VIKSSTLTGDGCADRRRTLALPLQVIKSSALTGGDGRRPALPLLKRQIARTIIDSIHDHGEENEENILLGKTACSFTHICEAEKIVLSDIKRVP
jgi:hypothetical protein